MGRPLTRVLAGAPFAGSALAAFAVDREAQGQAVHGRYEYAWGSFA